MTPESMRGSFEGQKDRYYIDQDIAGWKIAPPVLQHCRACIGFSYSSKVTDSFEAKTTRTLYLLLSCHSELTPLLLNLQGPVPVYIMLPLDSITMLNTVNRPRALRASLIALKSAGVEGVMVDVW
jgi:hypothetical protein